VKHKRERVALNRFGTISSKTGNPHPFAASERCSASEVRVHITLLSVLAAKIIGFLFALFLITTYLSDILRFKTQFLPYFLECLCSKSRGGASEIGL